MGALANLANVGKTFKGSILKLANILDLIQKTKGTNAKMQLVAEYADAQFFQQVVKLALDPFITFGVVKVPKVDPNSRNPMPEGPAWTRFLGLAERLSARQLTGNEALSALVCLFELCSPDDEKWMRAILEKRLSIGLSAKLFNRVIPGLIPEFEVSLAQPYEFKRLNPEWGKVIVEPKLDGIRCIALVRNGQINMFGRSGKEIENFANTIGQEMLRLPDGCYDGELIGANFQTLMEQAFRKGDIDVENVQFHVFDYLSVREWNERNHFASAVQRRYFLNEIISERPALKFVKLVPQSMISIEELEIQKKHDEFVSQGYEGMMLKNPKAPYNFGRSFDVMKLKSFHDVDLVIEALKEGSGKHEGRLGALVASYKGKEVCVGSGLNDELRETIWAHPHAYIGRMMEVQYQEETKDGSLRFPTFVRFRDDKFDSSAA